MRALFGRAAAPVALALATLAVYAPYLGTRLVSGNADGDALAYVAVLADAVEQARAGVFPAYVGQSPVRFNGGLYPQAQAPLFTLAAPVLDLVTLRALAPETLLNLLIVLAALLGAWGMFAVLRALAPGAPWRAAALAFAYVTCPGVLGVLLRLDMVTSFLTLPLLPWVWHAFIVAWRGDETRGGVALGLVLALLWAAHPPVALWTTFVGLVVGAVGLALTRRGARAAVVGTAVFAPAAAWWLATLLLLAGGGAGKVGLDSSGARLSGETLRHTLATLRGDFPAVLLPVGWVRGAAVNGWPEAAHEAAFVPAVWREGAVLPYLQLGYALWVALALAVVVALRMLPARARVAGDPSPRRGEGGPDGVMERAGLVALLGGVVLLLLFLLPIPWVSAWLWSYLPGIFEVTKRWPMQRLYLVLASLAAPVGLLAWSAWSAPGARGGAATRANERPRQRPAASRRAVAGALVATALVAWSAHEAAKFTAFGLQRRAQAPPSARPENLPLRPKDMQMSAPRLLPVYTDPRAHWRVVHAGGVLADNHAALLETCRNRSGRLPTLPDDTRFGRLTLAPGRPLLVCVRPGAPPGLLEAYGPDYYRHLRLTANAAPDVLPLETTTAEPLELNVRLTTVVGTQVRLDSLLALAGYAPEDLPVRVQAWVPLRVTADVPAEAASAWLETPRLFVPGYAARVDGLDVPVGRSDDGLATVPLGPGRHDVELHFAGPTAVRAAFPLSLAAWLAAAAVLAFPRPTSTRPGAESS